MSTGHCMCGLTEERNAFISLDTAVLSHVPSTARTAMEEEPSHLRISFCQFLTRVEGQHMMHFIFLLQIYGKLINELKMILTLKMNNYLIDVWTLELG